MKEDKIDRACSAHGVDEKCVLYKILVVKPEGKKPLTNV
jgi:hypothetical protein